MKSHKFVKSSFKTFFPQRAIFVNEPHTEILPTPSPKEIEVKTLSEALDEARKELDRYDARIKAIKDYYANKTMSPEVKKAHADYKKEREVLMKYMVDLGVYNKKVERDLKEEEIQLRETTLSKLNNVFIEFEHRQSEWEEGAAGDPLHGLRPKLRFPEEQQGKKSRKEGEEEKAAHGVEIKGEKAAVKESPEFWAARYRDITRKIITKAEGGPEESMTADERLAVMFMRGGETKEVILDGQKYRLERDIPGNYLRLRDYWKNKGEVQEGKPKEDPYVSSSGKNNIEPSWKTVTKTDIKVRKAEKTQQQLDLEAKKLDIQKQRKLGELEKQLNWLSADSTPAGSYINYWHFLSKEETGESEETLIGQQVNILKKYDGSLLVNHFNQHLIKKGDQMENQPKTDEKSRSFTDFDQCREYVSKLLRGDSQIVVSQASAEDLEKERQAFIDKKMKNLADNLAKASIFGVGSDAFKFYLKNVLDFVEKHKVDKWEQNKVEAFMGRHVEIADGKPNVFMENPEYEKYQQDNKKKRTEEAPQQYLALFPVPKTSGEEEVEEKAA